MHHYKNKPEFVKPSNSTDCYNIGDKITFNGKKYVCKINGCVWDPITYPPAWQEVVDSTENSAENTENNTEVVAENATTTKEVTEEE